MSWTGACTRSPGAGMSLRKGVVTFCAAASEDGTWNLREFPALPFFLPNKKAVSASRQRLFFGTNLPKEGGELGRDTPRRASTRRRARPVRSNARVANRNNNSNSSSNRSLPLPRGRLHLHSTKESTRKTAGSPHTPQKKKHHKTTTGGHPLGDPSQGRYLGPCSDLTLKLQ